MKNLLVHTTIILGMLTLAFLVGCESRKTDVEKGLLSVEAFNSEDITIVSKSISAASDDYQVTISQILTGEISYSTNYGSIKGTPLAIEQGMYRVSAQNINIEDAQWDAPRYAGTKEVTVKAGQNTTANIECRMTNVKVTVEYTDLLLSTFDINSVVVNNKDGGELNFLGNETRAGYFIPGELSITLKATKKADNSTKVITYPIIGADAATWCKVKVNVKLYAHTGFDITIENDQVEIHDTELDPLN